MHFFQSSYKEVNVNEIVVLAICAEFYDNYSNLNTPLLKKKYVIFETEECSFCSQRKKKTKEQKPECL